MINPWRIVATSCVLVTVAVVAFGSYFYIVSVRPVLREAHAELAVGQGVPSGLEPLVDIAERSSLAATVVRGILVGRPALASACPKRTLKRELCEVAIAETLGLSFSHPQLVELWSRVVYLGYRPPGLIHAARQHFGKDVAALTRAELAELVALAQAPSRYLGNPEALRKRTNWILSGARGV